MGLERLPGIGSRVLGPVGSEEEAAGEVVSVYGDAFAVETHAGRLFVPADEWASWDLVSRPVQIIEPSPYL